VAMDARTINADPGRENPTNVTTAATSGGSPNNPRLYEAGFALLNTGSKVTNVSLTFLGSQNANGREVIMAVSATAGAIPPVWILQPFGINTNEGVTVKFTGLAGATS